MYKDDPKTPADALGADLDDGEELSPEAIDEFTGNRGDDDDVEGGC